MRFAVVWISLADVQCRERRGTRCLQLQWLMLLKGCTGTNGRSKMRFHAARVKYVFRQVCSKCRFGEVDARHKTNTARGCGFQSGRNPESRCCRQNPHASAALALLEFESRTNDRELIRAQQPRYLNLSNKQQGREQKPRKPKPH